MRCESCGQPNDPAASACVDCGSALPRTCSDCARALGPDDNFCAHCGAPAVDRRSDLDADADAAGERRRITVLFCDLVSSADLSAKLDPEDLGELMGSYQRVCEEQATLYGGYVAQYLGDGALIYFGYPKAHEDGTYRAIRTALGIIDVLGTLNQRLDREQGIRLAVRIGLHTGLVVIGEVGRGERREPIALGDVPIIASRLMTLAPVDSVVVSADTAVAVRGRFRLEPMGPRSLKGIRQPVDVFRVLGEEASRVRPQLASGSTTLVGRDADIEVLSASWQRACRGRGQAVVLRGDAGMGKSRLVQALSRSVTGEVIEFQCSPVFRETAFHPFVSQLRRHLGLARGAGPAGIEEMRRQADRSGAPPELLRLIDPLLLSDEPGEDALRDEEHGERTTRALLEWTLDQARPGPTLLVWEDAHWGDPSSIELLGRIVKRIADLPVMVLITCRAAFSPAWLERVRSGLRRIELARLEREHATRMVDELTGPLELSERVVRELVEWTDGVPFFIEEFTRAVVESPPLRDRIESPADATTVRHLGIPATLQDLLMARLDRLSDLKPVIGAAAVLGREFDPDMLHAVTGASDVELESSLQRLVDEAVLVRRDDAPRGYVFRHALIQEAAYETQLRSARRKLHRRVAIVLEERQRATGSASFETVDLLAHHWARAVDETQPREEIVGKAVDWLTRAGENALRLSAYPEASNRLQRARKLLRFLSEGEERDARELPILEPMSSVVKVTRGWSSVEVREIYDRTRELCIERGDIARLARTLFRLWSYHLVRGEYAKSLRVAEDCFETAQSLDNPALLLEAHVALSNSQFWLCDLKGAVDNAERVLELYSPELHEGHLVIYGQDPRVHALMFLVWIPWMQGRLETAIRNMERQIRLADELQHPFSAAMALSTACSFDADRRDFEALLRDSERLIELSQEHGFPNYVMFASGFRGWALAHLGRADEIIDAQERGFAAASDVGLAASQFHFGMGEIYRQAGRLPQAVQVLTAGLDICERSQELVYQPELMRLRAEIMVELDPGEAVAAERDLRRALELAAERGQATYALRCATALARLAPVTGSDPAEARRLLESTHAPFRDSDEVDPRAAAALLKGSP